MADVIDITHKFHGRDNLITSRPLEFRRADWQTGFALMCTREESNRYLAHRLEALRTRGHQHLSFVPNHITLDGGYHYTLMGLFRHRRDENAMRRVYRLAAMMECVTNAPSPILRTDLLRRFYKTIMEERESLGILWRGSIRHFLFPLRPDLRNPNLFLHHMEGAESLKDLFTAIETETNIQFDLLAEHTTFYLPETLIAQCPLLNGT